MNEVSGAGRLWSDVDAARSAGLLDLRPRRERERPFVYGAERLECRLLRRLTPWAPVMFMPA
jgi:hypothetical protein